MPTHWLHSVRACLFRQRRRGATLRAIVTAFRSGKYTTTQHAMDQAFCRNVDLGDVEDGMRGDAPEIIEDRPLDRRGASCLILVRGPSGTAYHIVCSHAPHVHLITVYRPKAERWSADLRRRIW